MASGLTSVEAALAVLSAGWTQAGQGDVLCSLLAEAEKRRQRGHLCVSAPPARVGGCRLIPAMLRHLCYQHLNRRGGLKAVRAACSPAPLHSKWDQSWSEFPREVAAPRCGPCPVDLLAQVPGGQFSHGVAPAEAALFLPGHVSSHVGNADKRTGWTAGWVV